MIKFKEGIVPTIGKLYQKETYYGLIEGVPTTEMNQKIIASIRRQYVKQFLGLDHVFIIEPEEKIRHVDNNRVFANLPEITCMAELRYYDTEKEFEEKSSRVGLVWFQETYAFPVDDQVLQKIAEVSWYDIAETYRYD